MDFEHILQDIETLNQRAMREELDITAVSIHAYAHLTDTYALMHCGASMGDGYGPRIVARQPVSADELTRMTIAIPGTLTSAFLALQMYLGKPFEYRVVPFDRILETVRDGEADAGLVIHEGQLTYGDYGLSLVADLGIWWGEKTGGLPLPLGSNVVRKDLGSETMHTLTRVLRDSIIYGLEHRKEALDYAIDFGRGLDYELNDEFVGMYVNDLTRDYGERGRKAIERFLDEGATAGLVPRIAGLEFIDPA